MNKNKLPIFVLFLFIIGIILSVRYLISTNKYDNQIYETQSPFTTILETKSILTGKIEAKEQAEIKPHISGIIENLYVKEGQPIRKGDILATVTIIANAAEVSVTKSRINSDNIVLQNEKRNFSRVKHLFEQGVLPKIEFEKAETAFKIAEQNVISAQKQLQIAQTGVAPGASNHQIKATLGGVVTELFIEKGSQVVGASSLHTGTTIATIANLNVLLFRGKVDEIEAGRLKIGMPLSISIGALEDKKFEAKLTFISPKGTQENGSVQFDIEAEMKLKPQDNVRIGYSANAEITYGNTKETLVINESLVQYDQEGNPFVEIKTSENTFSKKNIQLGLSDGVNIEVLSGVRKKDKIKVWNISNKPNQPVLKRPNKGY